MMKYYGRCRINGRRVKRSIKIYSGADYGVEDYYEDNSCEYLICLSKNIYSI